MLGKQIFKANDIRAIVTGENPEFDIEGARALGGAFVALCSLEGHSLVLGRDMRVLGRELADAFISGATRAGADVVDIGLASTDELWFASGCLGIPGVQFTASHNPGEYNGVKFCLANAAPVSSDFMERLRGRAHEPIAAAARAGSVSTWDALPDYADYICELVGGRLERELSVVVDAGNGMAGHTAQAVMSRLGVNLIGLYLDLDGSFPNHPANPLIPEHLVDAQRAVVEHGADLAFVFDGDADRCFIIDETGAIVDPAIVTTLIALEELRREPGGVIVVNTITSAMVASYVAEAGGQIAMSKVGHTSVKAVMAEREAIFGGEHSAHYYFRDFWKADTGMLAAAHMLRMVAQTGQPLSSLAGQHERFVRSGEINFVVRDLKAVLDAVRAAFAGRGDMDESDGLTVRHGTRLDDLWWVNVRASNTEPLLRLNIEAHDATTMRALKDELATLIKEHS